jgi:hypothetical protein
MRSTLDKLISWIGLGLAAVMLVAGGLLTWASNFVDANVKEQLTAQNITMPDDAGIAGLEAKADQDALKPFIGQTLENGDQAKAYADHYILAHMNKSSGGKTYSQVSGEAMAAAKADPTSPETKQLMDLRQSLFMGSTLRGLLLYGYAFGTMGKIAGYAAIGAFAAAGLFLVLAFLGFSHAKRIAGKDDKVVTA